MQGRLAAHRWRRGSWEERGLEVKLLCYREIKAMIWEQTQQLVCPFEAQLQTLSEQFSRDNCHWIWAMAVRPCGQALSDSTHQLCHCCGVCEWESVIHCWRLEASSAQDAWCPGKMKCLSQQNARLSDANSPHLRFLRLNSVLVTDQQCNFEQVWKLSETQIPHL